MSAAGGLVLFTLVNNLHIVVDEQLTAHRLRIGC